MAAETYTLREFIAALDRITREEPSFTVTSVVWRPGVVSPPRRGLPQLLITTRRA